MRRGCLECAILCAQPFPVCIILTIIRIHATSVEMMTQEPPQNSSELTPSSKSICLFYSSLFITMTRKSYLVPHDNLSEYLAICWHFRSAVLLNITHKSVIRERKIWRFNLVGWECVTFHNLPVFLCRRRDTERTHRPSRTSETRRIFSSSSICPPLPERFPHPHSCTSLWGWGSTMLSD